MGDESSPDEADANASTLVGTKDHAAATDDTQAKSDGGDKEGIAAAVTPPINTVVGIGSPALAPSAVSAQTADETGNDDSSQLTISTDALRGGPGKADLSGGKTTSGTPHHAKVAAAETNGSDLTDGAFVRAEQDLASASKGSRYSDDLLHHGAPTRLASGATGADAPGTTPAGPLVSAPLSDGAGARPMMGADASPTLRLAEQLYAPHQKDPAHTMTGFARFGTIGQDTGVALARAVVDGRDHVALRLDPPDLGRIDVHLSFGADGGLRAVVASDNRAALDLLRHDLDQLQRALADAGVRAETSSFQFSDRQSSGGQRWDAPVAREPRVGSFETDLTELPLAPVPARPLRSSGLVDVIA